MGDMWNSYTNAQGRNVKAWDYQVRSLKASHTKPMRLSQCIGLLVPATVMAKWFCAQVWVPLEFREDGNISTMAWKNEWSLPLP